LLRVCWFAGVRSFALCFRARTTSTARYRVPTLLLRCLPDYGYSRFTLVCRLLFCARAVTCLPHSLHLLLPSPHTPSMSLPSTLRYWILAFRFSRSIAAPGLSDPVNAYRSLPAVLCRFGCGWLRLWRSSFVCTVRFARSAFYKTGWTHITPPLHAHTHTLRLDAAVLDWMSSSFCVPTALRTRWFLVAFRMRTQLTA